MSRRRVVLVSVVACLLAVGAFTIGRGATQRKPGRPPSYAPGEVLVKFKSGTDDLDRGAARGGVGAASLSRFRSGGERWRLGHGVSVEGAVEILSRNPRVEYAHPNYRIIPATTVNDPEFANQSYLSTIKAPAAWDVTKGCGVGTPGCSRAIKVAVLDSGIVSHSDLEANVDRSLSYDFADDDTNASPLCEFIQSHSHGTQIAGVIGAVTNNGVGVAGINWNVQLMAHKIFSPTNTGAYIDSAIEAIEYAVDHGVDVINASWTIGAEDCTGTPCAPLLYEAIEDAGLATPGILFIAAAGNGGHDIDASPLYPPSYDLDNVISVAGTDVNDALSGSSNYGQNSVDLAAPFTTKTTTPGSYTPCNGDPECEELFCFPLGPGGGPFGYGEPTYDTVNGTSFSAPQVAGVAALLRAVNPNATVAQVKSALLNSTDPRPSLQGTTVSGGRLNASCALQTLTGTYTGNPVVQVVWPNGGNTLYSNTTVNLTWTASDDCGGVSSVDILLSRNGSGGTYSTIASGIPNTGSYSWVVTGPATTQAFLKVVARDSGSNTGQDLSNAAFRIKTNCGPCVTDYCGGEGWRCWWNNTCNGGCCNYACEEDPSCTLPDPLPPNACG